jgi:hypothetical protein
MAGTSPAMTTKGCSAPAKPWSINFFLKIGINAILLFSFSLVQLMPPLPSPNRPARDRDLRRLRILSQVQAGFSYAAIGRDEGLSRERVRQIVSQALGEEAAETKLDHARVQIARLEPALRLAARAVADGDLAAIDRLLRVLDRLDKYSVVEGADRPYDENARERLLTKLNAMSERMIAARERKEGDEAAPEGEDDDAAAGETSPNGDAALDAL